MKAPILIQLIIIYQAWSGECIVTAERAHSIISALAQLAGLKTKAEAIKVLVDQGWSDTKSGAKPLVDKLWLLREEIALERQRIQIEKLMEIT